MASIEELAEKYNQGHETPINRVLHILGVIILTAGLLGLLWSVPSGLIKSWLGDHPLANWATVYAVLMIIYYGSESFSLTFAGGIFYQGLLFGLLYIQDYLDFPMYIIGISLFAFGMLLFIVGHSVQGNLKELSKDIKYLVISPTWVFRFIYRSMGISF